MLTSLLEEFCQQRMVYAFENELQESEDYQRADKRASETLNRMLAAAQNEKQQDALDELASAYNACGVEYAKVAYRQGFADGIKLLMEIIQLQCDEA